MYVVMGNYGAFTVFSTVFSTYDVPQLRGLVPGAGCQKGRRWVERDRRNIVAVPL